MSILTKEERAEWRDLAESMKGLGRYESDGWSDEKMLDALDTIDALEAERTDTWDVLARAGIPGEDEQIALSLAVERLWLAYEGAAHSCGKWRKKVATLEAERDALKTELENERRKASAVWTCKSCGATKDHIIRSTICEDCKNRGFQQWVF